MNKAATLSLGASLLTFGCAWIFLSLGIVEVLYGSNGNGAVLLALEVVSAVLVTLGVGLLVYGASRTAERA
jgi:hypothetical protein